MIDITEMVRKQFAALYLLSKCGPLISGAVGYKARYVSESFFKYPSYSCTTIQEIFLKGEEMVYPVFNVVLSSVMYQGIEGDRGKFHLSDGLTRIEARELFPSLLPWRWIDRKLTRGERIFVMGQFNGDAVDMFLYKSKNPKGKRKTKTNGLERMCLSLADNS